MKTFGRLTLTTTKPRKWHVADLVPHVAIAFKRLFPRAAQHDVEHFLSDTDEVRADLLWFTSRYPLETADEHELRLGAKRVEARMAERDRILTPDWQPAPLKGFKPGKAPYQYQSQAATICLAQGGLLLGDDVGLGKTVTAFALLTMGAPLPAGVVVQPHLAEQWAKKCAEFTHLRTHIIRSRTPYNLPPADLYIFRYSNVGGWNDFLKNGLLKTVIYDEIQELRHGATTDKGLACQIISWAAKLVLGLTATPIYNYGDEIHSVMRFVNRDVLGTREEFLREWCGSGKTVTDPDALGAFLRDTGWFLRRDEDDPSVDRSMPPPNVVTVPVAWDSGDAADDAAITRALALSVMNGSFVQAGSAARELDARMRQLTGVAKARAVAALVRMLIRGGAPRVLLAGWHRDVYALWRKLLADYEPVQYTGSETAAHKARAVEDFTVGNSRVMFISLRSGVGLDGLQHFCRDVVIGEFDWSPQVHHQIVGRCRRPGQLEQVNVFYPHTHDGSDPVMLETLGIKSDQARGVTAPGLAPKQQYSDVSRVKRLAQYVLDGGAIPEPCEICGEVGTGSPTHIIPLSAADDYPAGPERDALFGPDNVWFLCEAHRAAHEASE